MGSEPNEAVNELVFHLVLSIVIIAILLIFVLGWRESLIVTFTVPAILAITLFIAYITGQTVNRITLFAFLLSLGSLSMRRSSLSKTSIAISMHLGHIS
jgi:multidrug efflux pump subunit AcrB